MGWRQKPIAPGDRFTRSGHSSRVFVVTTLDSRPGLPLHARMQAEENPTEQITIAVSALNDSEMFRRL